MTARVRRDVSSSYQFRAISPSDTVDLPDGVRGVYVGGPGNIAIVGLDGAVVTFTGVLVGSILPVQARRINVTNTTATNLVALY